MTTFGDLCRRTHEQMAGRARAEDVAKHVALQMEDERYVEVTWKGFVGQVGSELRRVDSDTGLPQAPCVGGVYVQESLLTVDEYRSLIGDHMQAATRSRGRARKYAEQCLAVHEIWIDPAEAEAAS